MTRRLGDLLTSAFCKGSVWNGGVLYDDSPPKKVIYDAQPADQNLWSCSTVGRCCRNQEVAVPSHVTILAKSNAAWPSNCMTGAKTYVIQTIHLDGVGIEFFLHGICLLH